MTSTDGNTIIVLITTILNDENCITKMREASYSKIFFVSSQKNLNKCEIVCYKPRNVSLVH